MSSRICVRLSSTSMPHSAYPSMLFAVRGLLNLANSMSTVVSIVNGEVYSISSSSGAVSSNNSAFDGGVNASTRAAFRSARDGMVRSTLRIRPCVQNAIDLSADTYAAAGSMARHLMGTKARQLIPQH